MKLKKILLFLMLFFVFNINTFAYTKAVIDITNMDIEELQEAIDKGYLTYELLITLYLERIEAYDKNYNAIISINKNALEEAKKLDKEYQEKGRRSLLHGIPILVKDNIDVKGMATTAGAKALADNVAKSNAKLVQDLIDKGAIILAKTNMSEFAFMASSSKSSYGSVKNAYNKDYSSYGSSGGSAVGVALSYAPLAIGTDTNLSLRAPSSANSVIGLRPTFNKISTDGIIAYDITRDVAGPIAKSVRDSAILFSALTNDDKYLDTNYSLEGLRIGVLDEFSYGDSLGYDGLKTPYSEIKTMFDEALSKLEENKATIVHIKDFYKQDYYNVYSSTLGGWTMCSAFNTYIKNSPSSIDSFSKLAKSSKKIYSLSSYLSDCRYSVDDVYERYNKKKETYKKDLETLFKENSLDVLVYPTTKNKLLKLDKSGLESPGLYIAPVLGVPSVSTPLGFDSNNLPYGIEFLTLANKEELLYRAIGGFEKINDVYKLPDDAKPLYEVPTYVLEFLKLMEEKPLNSYYYKKDLNLEKESLEEEIKTFIKNYNEIEDTSSVVEELTLKYNNLIDLATAKKSIALGLAIYIVFAIISVGIASNIIKKSLKKKRRKKKKRR